MKLMRTQLKMPFGLSSTRAMLEAGALILGTETELVLKSRRVVPKKLLDAGFAFRFPNADEALKDLLSHA